MRSGRTPRKAARSTFRLAVALVLAVPLVAPARSDGDCLVDYADCVLAASDLDSFGRRSLAGLRCYSDFLSCLQRRLA
jgi:hypothetical protein